MRELIEQLDTDPHADYLLDTCFLFYMLDKGHSKQLLSFCKANKVGMTSFNLAEVDHVHHRLPGTMNHHVRDFLKSRVIVNVPVGVVPGDRDGEKSYVSSYDDGLLQIVRDASDAVLLVAAMKIHADVLTRDKHHVFTAVCENHIQQSGIVVLNELPAE
jgi:hypothetical protein